MPPDSPTSCLCVGAPRTEVRLDGQAAPRVRLDSLETALGAAPRATFSVGLGREAGAAEDFRVENALPEIGPGRSVTARLIEGGLLPGSEGAGQVLFEGRIVRLEANLDGDGESLRFEAEDAAADVLRRRTAGQRILTAAGQAEVVEGLGLVFNPEGRPNAAYCAVPTRGGRCLHDLCAGGRPGGCPLDAR